ncbi:hypothetical protein UT300012_40620 [Paraclostridium bifermentans]
MPLNINVKMDGIKKILSRRNLEERGRAQEFFTNEVARISNPYVPFKSGTLKDSQVTISNGKIEYKAPYARRQYYSNSGNGKQGTNKGGIRGKRWTERMWADKGSEIVKSVAVFVGGRSR